MPELLTTKCRDTGAANPNPDGRLCCGSRPQPMVGHGELVNVPTLNEDEFCATRCASLALLKCGKLVAEVARIESQQLTERGQCSEHMTCLGSAGDASNRKDFTGSRRLSRYLTSNGGAFRSS